MIMHYINLHFTYLLTLHNLIAVPFCHVVLCRG